MRYFALLLVLPTLVVQAASTTAAGAVVVAGFEIDGNVPDGAEAGVDWGTPVGVTAADPVGNADTTNFGVGSKEFDHPTTWERKTGVAPPQDDISAVYFHDAIVAGDIWGFVGFRRSTTSGTTNFDVEFNKLPNASGATYVPVRSVGDVMVRFEQDGSAAFTLTQAWFWTRVASPDWGAGCIEVPGYTPRSGWCSEAIGSVPFTGATGENGLFAEGAFNFSSLLEAGGIGEVTCAGGDFGTMNIRSFTGNSDASSLKDYINPVTIDIDDTCGELEIYKIDQFGNSIPGATFSISPNPVPGQTASPLVIVEGGAGDPDNEADGDIVIDPATPGVYTVIETAAPAGYELVQPVSARTWTVTVTQTSTTWTGPGQTTGNGPVAVTNRRYFQAPSVANTPTASYDIDYNWKVRKSVNRTRADIPAGGSAAFDYTVTLEALDPTRSGHQLRGVVTATNPNALPMKVTLAIAGPGCTYDNALLLDADDQTAGFQVLVPSVTVDADGVQVPYTCAPGPNPPDGSTTATMTWSQVTYPQNVPNPTYERTAQTSYAFAINQPPTDLTTTVFDTFNGGTAENLGTFNWNDVRGESNANTPPHTVVVKTYTRNIPGVAGTCTDYPNTATESADGTEANQSVKVCVGANLNVTKDAKLGYQRELLWDIAKSGPGTVFVGEDGEGELSASVDFTIDITADGRTDSAWALTGSILIDNPNDWPVTVDVTDTVVIDTKNVTCTIDGGSSVQVPANAVDHTVTYDCPGVEQGDYVGKNTVTIDWSADSHAYPTTSDSDTQDVQVTGDPDPENADVTLTDLLEGEDVTADLPDSTFNWAEVHAMEDHTQSITYSVVLDTRAGKCTPYTNVVSINGIEGATDDGEAVICSPGVAKTYDADYGRKQLWDITKVVDKTDVEISQGGSATFTYTVTATPGQVVGDGTSSWSGSVSVTNPSEDEALTVDIDDIPAVAGWTCSFDDDNTQVEIAAGGAVELDYTCSGTGHPSGTNTAVVSFGDDESVSDTVDVVFAPRAGVRDSVVEVYDDKTNPDAPPVPLGEADAADGPTDFTYEVVKSGTAGACTTYTNTAWAVLEASEDPDDTATAKLCVEKPLTVDVSGSGSYGVTYPWTIDKVLEEPRTIEVDAATGEATFDYEVIVTAGDRMPADWTLSGTVKVTNPNTYAEGAITLTDVDISTNVGGGAICSAAPPAAPIAPGANVVIPFSCTFPGPGDPGTSGTVTADVSWDPAGAATSDTESDSSDVSLTVGEEVDKVIDVWDDKTDPANPVLLSGEEGLTWSEGLVKTYSYSVTHQGTAGQCDSFTNIAWLDLAGENEPHDTTTATVCVEEPLDAEVSASGSLARTYAWSVAKVADATTRTVDGTGKATFRYTVTARAGAMTESGWTMGGQVTVANPNTYEDGDITADVAVTSDLGGGVSCTVSGGQDVVVPAVGEGEDGTVTLPFTCSFGSQPSGSGTVSTTVTWDPSGEDSSAAANDSSPVTLTVASETNKTVEVVDDKTVTGQRIVLDPALTWSAGLVKTYTYDLAVAGGAAGTCRSHTNTATVDQPVGTDPTATAVVLACAPPPPEVLAEQSFGKAGGSVRASCQGTVRSKLNNRSGVEVTYQLRVGKKVHKIVVKSLSEKRFTTTGKARAKVVLKAQGRTLDRVRIPSRCVAPEVLPDTGMRAAEARLGSITRRWRT